MTPLAKEAVTPVTEELALMLVAICAPVMSDVEALCTAVPLMLSA
jgi:hypothetical protein